MSRKKLMPRHPCETRTVSWSDLSGMTYKFIATFGFDADMRVKEVFCASFKGQSGTVAFANDACIAVSRLLQHGVGIEEIASSLSENRLEGQDVGDPASPLGAIVRMGVEVERCYHTAPPAESEGEGVAPPEMPRHPSGSVAGASEVISG